jgi:hypothetical protein
MRRCFVNLNKCDTREWIKQNGYTFDDENDCFVDLSMNTLWGVCFNEVIILPARITTGNLLEVCRRKIFNDDWTTNVLSRLVMPPIDDKL